MRIVSKKTEAEIAATRAEEDALQSLKKLTGELMRIARGAGKPYAVEEFAGAFLANAQRYRETTGHGLSTDKIATVMQVRAAPIEHDGFASERLISIEQAISGSLQVAASRLLQDRLRELSGKDEIFRSMQDWVESREIARKEAEREKRQLRAALAKSSSVKARGRKRK